MSKPRLVFIFTLLALAAWCAASSTAGYTGSLDTTLKVANTGSGKAIVGTASGSSATAVLGRGTGGSSTGVHGTGGSIGVRGESPTGTGVEGYSPSGVGVVGTSDYGTGVSGQGLEYGVSAYSTEGYGVSSSGVIGVSGSSWANDGIGVSAYIGASGGVNKGVDAYASGGSVAYGVYSTANGASQNWAGYFSGNVHVTGSVSWVSDARFKKNIRPMADGLGKVMALSPKTYEMRVGEFQGMELAGGGQYGLIAEEVESVLPELVVPVTAPAEPAGADPLKNRKGPLASYKSVNYTALIPILIEAVQEQQKIIREQQARLEALEARGTR